MIANLKQKRSFTVEDSGVNYSFMDPFKNAALKASGNPPQIIEFPDFYLVDVLEGVGSLNQLADDLYAKTNENYYYQSSWGNAASILNDLSSFGAKPLTLKMFIAVGHQSWFPDKKRANQIIKAFADAAKYTNSTWNGGETQTLVGVIQKSSFVIAGSVTGIINPKSSLYDEKFLQDGDRIILIPSSGVHVNGITLIRKLFKNNLPVLKETIKNKTVIYSKLINTLQDQKVEVHFASHITGHGWRKIMRSQRNFTYTLEKIPKVPKIFKQIQKEANMSTSEMYGDYNMGAGFALFVPSKSVDKVLTAVYSLSMKALNAGFIKKGPRQVIIEPLNIRFRGEALQIR